MYEIQVFQILKFNSLGRFLSFMNPLFIYFQLSADILDRYGHSFLFVQGYLFCVSTVDHIQLLNFGTEARWGPGLVQACQWHSIAQQLLVAVTLWPAFPLRSE